MRNFEINDDLFDLYLQEDEDGLFIYVVNNDKEEQTSIQLSPSQADEVLDFFKRSVNEI
jgi:hypothetical protein